MPWRYNQFFMRQAIFLILLFNFVTAFGQKIDSIKYSNGFLYFHEYGKGTPIILLTGGPGANYQQLAEVAVTIGNRYRVILPEQRGTGRSIPTPFDTSTINLANAKADLNLLLTHLKLKEAIFVGHSWGAMLAMSFACDHPSKVKSLLLIAPGPFKFDPTWFDILSTNIEARLTAIDKQTKDSALRKMQSKNATEKDSSDYYKWELVPFFNDKTKVDSLVPIINKGGLNPKMGGLIFQSLAKEKFNLAACLSRFNKPVHIITGVQDPMAFITYEIKIISPKAKLYWINKAGHFPMYEQPKQFYSEIFKALDEK